MSRRRAIAASNRRRAAAHSQAYAQPRKVVEGRRLLEATDGSGYFSAEYEKRDGKWVFKDSEGLEFLRYCGKPEDAKKAMERRGLQWRWR